MTSPKWIKPELFVEVLKEIEPNYKRILKFTSCPAMKPGENYATLLLRIDIEIELKDNQPKEFFFMLKSALEQSLLDEVSDGHDLFAIEKVMYADVVPELEQMYKVVGANVTFMPRCYELKLDKKHILMENMCSRGFEMADRLKGLYMEHLECALEKMAQWHAATAVRVEKKGKYNDKMSASSYVDLLLPFVKVMINSHLECIQGIEKFSELYQKTKKYSEQISEIMKTETNINSEEFNVLCHGDFWTNNILFQYNEQKKLLGCVLMDYQVPRYGPPAYDLFHLIMTGATLNLKVSKFDYFIKFYFDNLIKNLKLLKYAKSLPKLRDIHIMLLKNTSTAFVCSSLWPAPTMLESSDNSNVDNLLGNSDNALEFRKKMFSNPKFLQNLEIVGDWLLNRGYFD